MKLAEAAKENPLLAKAVASGDERLMQKRNGLRQVYDVNVVSAAEEEALDPAPFQGRQEAEAADHVNGAEHRVLEEVDRADPAEGLRGVAAAVHEQAVDDGGVDRDIHPLPANLPAVDNEPLAFRAFTAKRLNPLNINIRPNYRTVPIIKFLNFILNV